MSTDSQESSRTNTQKKQVFVQLDLDDDNQQEEDPQIDQVQIETETDGNYLYTQDNLSHRPSFTPELYQPSENSNVFQGNHELQGEESEPLMDEATELFYRILQEGLDRQDQIYYALGEDIQLPMLESNLNSYQDLSYILHQQLGYIFDYYEDLRKNHSTLFNSTTNIRALIREKEALQTQLKIFSDDNKDLTSKIKKLSDELDDLQRRLNNEQESIETKSQKSMNNSISGGSSHRPKRNKQIIKQFINLEEAAAALNENSQMDTVQSSNNALQDLNNQLLKDLRKKEDRLDKQSDLISKLEKEIYGLKDLKEREEQKFQNSSSSSKGINQNSQKPKYHLSLSQIEESDHETSYTRIEYLSKKAVEEKDKLIDQLQEKLNSLLSSSVIHMNVFAQDLTIGNKSPRLDLSSLSPKPRGNSFKALGKSPNNTSSKKILTIDQIPLSKDSILKTQNQAQIIEEMLKKTQQQQQNSQMTVDLRKHEDIYLKMDDMNKEYANLIKKFKQIEREKGGLLRTIDDLMRANGMLENDFKIVFRQVSEFNDQRLREDICKRDFTTREQNIPEPEIQDYDNLLEYIQLLFEENNYLQAIKLWQKIQYRDLISIHSSQNIDLLKISLKIKDDQISELQKRLPNKVTSQNIQTVQSLYDTVITSDQITKIIQNHFTFRDSRIQELERELNHQVQQTSSQAKQLDQVQNKLDIISGELDFERRKNERLRIETDQVNKELRNFKEVKLAEAQERYEREIGCLMNEIRALKKNNQRLQSDLATRESNEGQILHSEDGDDEILSNLSEMKGSQIPYKGTPSFNEDDDLGNFDRSLKSLYSKFFSSEYKQAQDKIRNKNSIFKQLYKLVSFEYGSIADFVNDQRGQMEVENRKRKKAEAEKEIFRKDIEKSIQYANKMLLQYDEGASKNKNIQHQQIKLFELLRCLKKAIKVYVEVNYKVTKLRTSPNISDSDIESDYESLSRMEALQLLKDLQQENDNLLKRSEMLDLQLMEIAKRVKTLQSRNKILERENDDLRNLLTSSSVASDYGTLRRLSLQTNTQNQGSQRLIQSAMSKTSHNSGASTQRNEVKINNNEGGSMLIPERENLASQYKIENSGQKEDSSSGQSNRISILSQTFQREGPYTNEEFDKLQQRSRQSPKNICSSQFSFSHEPNLSDQYYTLTQTSKQYNTQNTPKSANGPQLFQTFSRDAPEPLRMTSNFPLSSTMPKQQQQLNPQVFEDCYTSAKKKIIALRHHYKQNKNGQKSQYSSMIETPQQREGRGLKISQL